MKTSLIALLGAGVLGAVSGCAPTAPSIVRPFPEGHIRNYQFPERTQNDLCYSLERAVIHGQDYYMRKMELSEGTTGQLGFSISKVDENILSFDLDSSELELLPQLEFVPVRVKFGGYDSTKKDEWADRVILRAGYSRGAEIQGVKARIISLNELEKRLNSGGRYGWSAVTNEQDIQYGILTMTINGDDFFFPHVEPNKVDDFHLPFYLVPTKGAQIILGENGVITIQNPNRIFWPVRREHAEVPEDEKHLAGDLFKNITRPNIKYYVIGNQGFGELPDSRIEKLDEKGLIILREAIKFKKERSPELERDESEPAKLDGD